jgi:hypothetical protein
MKFGNPIVDVRLLRTRWLLTMTLALAAAFLVVESYAFSAGTASGIGFAVSIGMLVVGGALFATSRRARQYLSVPARDLRVAAWDGIAGLSIVVAGWNIVQSLVFGAGTARWLTFADGLGIVAVSVIGLVLHELSTERVVHSLEVVREEATADDVHHAAAA